MISFNNVFCPSYHRTLSWTLLICFCPSWTILICYFRSYFQFLLASHISHFQFLPPWSLLTWHCRLHMDCHLAWSLNLSIVNYDHIFVCIFGEKFVSGFWSLLYKVTMKFLFTTLLCLCNINGVPKNGEGRKVFSF